MKRIKSFTLLEIMMAVVITAVILVVIASSFNLAMKVYRRVKEGETSQVHDFIEQISRDLSSAYLYGNASFLIFKGDPNSLMFTTVVSLKYNFKHPKDCDLRRVKYYLSSVDNNISLYKSLFSFIEGESSKEIRKTKFIESLSLLRFSYYDGKKWLNSWNSFQELPHAVKIWIKLNDKPDSAYNVFATTIDIPCE